MEEAALKRFASYLRQRKTELETQSNAINVELTGKFEKVAKKAPKINWENEIVKIMKKGKGPFSKIMLANELDKKFNKKVELYHQTLMLEISSVLLYNKRFRRVKKGGWELNE